MKKILLLSLLITAPYLGFSQALLDEGIQLSGNVKTTTANKVLMQEDDGLLNYKDKEVFTENSAGALSGFALTNNGNGTVNIASGYALLRATNDENGILQKYLIPAVTNLALTDNVNNFVIVQYNGGSPNIAVITDPNLITTTNNTLIYVIARYGTTVNYLYTGEQNVDSNGKLRRRFLNVEPIKRAAGAVIGFTNRTISTTAGLFYGGLTPYTTPLLGATFTNVYNNGSVWTRQTAQTQVNNTQYNLNGVLTNMTNGRFRTDFVYIMANNPGVLYTVMGTSQTNTLADARLVTMPSALPVELQRLGVLVGRLIIGTNNAAITEVSSAYEITFNASTVINHNDTGNIQGGAVGDYQHVTTAEKTSWGEKVTKTTISQLRAFTGALPNTNFYTTDFGQEGNWYYDAADTVTSDNTGTVLVTADGKRLKRVISNFISLKWFGTIGNGITEETSLIQSAINESSTNQVKLVFEKSKTYITSTLVPKNNLFIDLNGSTLKLKANTNDLLFNGEEVAGNNFTIANGTLDGNKTNNQINFNRSGGGVWLRSWDNVVFDNLKMNNFFRAVFFISVNNYLTVRNVEINSCGISNAFGLYSYGLETEICNNMIVDNLKVENMYGYGMHFLNTTNAKASGLFFSNMSKTGESIAITTTNANYLDISNVKCSSVDGDNIEINSTKNSNFRNITIDSSGDIALLFGDHFNTGTSNENINVSGVKITNTGGTNSLSLNNIVYCHFRNIQADKGLQTLNNSFYPNDGDNSIVNSKFGVNLQFSYVYYKKFNLKGVNFTNFYVNTWERGIGVVSNAQVGADRGLTVLNGASVYVSFSELNQYGVRGNLSGRLRVNSIFNNQQASYQECLFLGSNNGTTLNIGTISQINAAVARPMVITTEPANSRIVLTNNTGNTLTVFWTIEVINNN
jgi:hypothetical protein